MICDVEIPYGPRTLLVGDISETNESFDHAFGREREVSYEVTAFRVYEYNNNIKDWVNTTASIHARDPHQFEILKSFFLLKAQGRIEMESA